MSLLMRISWIVFVEQIFGVLDVFETRQFLDVCGAVKGGDCVMGVLYKSVLDLVIYFEL